VPTPPCLLQARLPEIEELQKQLTATQAELTEAAFKAQEEAAAAAARQAASAAEAEALQQRIDEVAAEKLELDAALLEATGGV
jgi:hypothetical protein